ncbi:WS/DGAT/MGAT family O-acyltransferase [Nocardioides speluncae]|uniref:WS/DGAT/MGAT family O-acyltransferase n=1 Tax=Nocardioides speluncae TaxID=2670337 RepID=UPI000D69FD15|nr:wax ester/triacylglycerol synthase family O-acyltransferase [Nocardioides speluncae]
MERLSGLDASFLYLETPEQMMHVCAIVVVDPSTMPTPYSYPVFRNEIERRVQGLPEFTSKLRGVPLGLDHPLLVPDESFDIDRHVHRHALPNPGGYDELVELAGHLAGIPLDRSRPLWEMHVIEGYAEDKVAVFTKMHHATVDGVSGANLVSYLCSLEPDSEPLRPPAPEAEPVSVPGDLTLLGQGLLSTLKRPAIVPKLLAPSTRLVANWVTRGRQGTAMPTPFSAPRAPFNGTITGHRAVAFTDLELDKIKAIKNVSETTVNDVVLAVVGDALRSYLAAKDELPPQSLLATVPVSVHQTSERSGGSNKVSALFARLFTDVEEPAERLRLMAAANRNAKDHHKAVSADMLQDWAEFAAPRTFGLAVRAYAALRLAERHPVVHNLVVSNVPGPPIPLYFMGARIDALYPLGPVFHGAGLNVTVVSNNGAVHVGIIACREQVPDVDLLAGQVPAALERLRDAVLPEAKPKAARRPRKAPTK